MRERTLRQTIDLLLSTTAGQVLGANPRRKAFLMSPIAGNGTSAPLAVQVFTAGGSQLWTVPVGVTSVIDAFAWGSGGNPGVAGAVLGGGGGGGGGFCNTGAKTVTPGSKWTITVDAAGAAGSTLIQDAAVTTLAIATSGANGILDAAGVGGAGAVGPVQENGGNGAAATALAGKGGGGGGAGGYAAAGSNGAADVGGPGGGAVTFSTYGVGGKGGDGGLTTAIGKVGQTPGGGGGGSGNNGPVAPGGFDGLAVIVYQPSDMAQAISMSIRPDVTVGHGSLNWIPGCVYPFWLSDLEVGDAITYPWFAISGVANVPMTIEEFMCEEGRE